MKALLARIGDAGRFQPVKIVMVRRIGGPLAVGFEDLWRLPFVWLSVSVGKEETAALNMAVRRQVLPHVRRHILVAEYNQGPVVDTGFVLVGEDKDLCW